MIQIEARVNNLTKDALQTLRSTARWNYRKKEFGIGADINTYRHWNFGVHQKWGKPLDTTYVTDCRSFTLSYLLRNSGKVTIKTN